MIIKDLKTLEQLIKLCRKQGILAIKIGNMEFRLDETVQYIAQRRAKPVSTITPISPGGITEDTRVEMPDQLTEEQLLMWSVGASAENN